MSTHDLRLSQTAPNRHRTLLIAPAVSIYLIVVVALALLGVLTVFGWVVLSWIDKQLPESVIVLGSVAVGALAGMVVPTVR